MPFSDIHTHILYKTDDGAKTREEMFELVGKAYEHGTRLLCATPHFHPGYFGDNREEMQYAFTVLSEYCKEKYSDLTLVLGNELFYTHDSISWMKNNLCIPMGNTRYVLTEFSVDDNEDYIAEGILQEIKEVSTSTVRFRVEVDFAQMKDEAKFYYDCGSGFESIGIAQKLYFKLDHFTGCRFGLFVYSTKETGGSAEFSDFVYDCM